MARVPSGQIGRNAHGNGKRRNDGRGSKAQVTPAPSDALPVRPPPGLTRGGIGNHWWNKTQPTNAAQPTSITTSTNWKLCRPRCCRCHFKSWKGLDWTESRSNAAMESPAIVDAGKLGRLPSLPAAPTAPKSTKLFLSPHPNFFSPIGGTKLASRRKKNLTLFPLCSYAGVVWGKAAELRLSVAILPLGAQPGLRDASDR